MRAALEQNVARYNDLEQQMGDPAVLANPTRFTKVVKEHGRLAKVVKPYQAIQQLEAQIKQAEEMVAAETDAEMRVYAEEELAGLRAKHVQMRTQMEDSLLESTDEDFDSVIVEIRAGTGGDEAALFAGDLYEMYTRYAREQGWKVEEIAFSPGEAGGFKEVVFGVTGDGAFRSRGSKRRPPRPRVPRRDPGPHPRPPPRSIMPEPDEAQVNASARTWKSHHAGRRAGGQHVNKTESASASSIRLV